MEKHESLFNPSISKFVRPLSAALMAASLFLMTETATNAEEYPFSVEPEKCGTRFIPSWKVNRVKQLFCRGKNGESAVLTFDHPKKDSVQLHIGSIFLPKAGLESIATEMIEPSFEIDRDSLFYMETPYPGCLFLIDTTKEEPKAYQFCDPD